MKEKLTFAPCVVEIARFDGEQDVIVTSNAKENFSWWGDDGDDWMNGGNDNG